jgi:hypothetical protein
MGSMLNLGLDGPKKSKMTAKPAKPRTIDGDRSVASLFGRRGVYVRDDASINQYINAVLEAIY